MTVKEESKKDYHSNPPKRWTASRKKDVVIRMLGGEPVDAISRELGVSISQLEKWKEKVLTGIDLLLKERVEDPLYAELEAAKKRIGELCMENELYKEKDRRKGAFHKGRWKK